MKTKIKYFLNTTKADYSLQIINARNASLLSGPPNSQNPQSFYDHSCKSKGQDHVHQGIAMHNGQIVGYVISRLFHTAPIFPFLQSTFSAWKTYKPYDLGNNLLLTPTLTLTVNEICVREKSQGLGIASNLLDTLFVHLLDRNADVKHVEFSILASNSASELLFTSFAERYASTCTIGASQFSSWGNYIPWTLLIESNKIDSKVIFNSHFMDYIPDSNSGGLRGLKDRMDLIERSKLRQMARFG